MRQSARSPRSTFTTFAIDLEKSLFRNRRGDVRNDQSAWSKSAIVERIETGKSASSGRGPEIGGTQGFVELRRLRDADIGGGDVLIG